MITVKDVTITISGPTGSGKSLIGILINTALKNAGLMTRLDSADNNLIKEYVDDDGIVKGDVTIMEVTTSRLPG